MSGIRRYWRPRPRKQTSERTCLMSAKCQSRHFALRKTTSLFDHLVGEGKDRIRDRESDRLGGSEIEDHVELRSLFNGQIGRLCTLEYLVHEVRAAAVQGGPGVRDGMAAWLAQMRGLITPPISPRQLARIDLIGRPARERRVWSICVVRSEPTVDTGLCLAAGLEGIEDPHSYLSDRHSRSMNTLSVQRPRPSIETRTPASDGVVAEAKLVNCEP